MWITLLPSVDTLDGSTESCWCTCVAIAVSNSITPVYDAQWPYRRINITISALPVRWCRVSPRSRCFETFHCSLVVAEQMSSANELHNRCTLSVDCSSGLPVSVNLSSQYGCCICWNFAIRWSHFIGRLHCFVSIQVSCIYQFPSVSSAWQPKVNLVSEVAYQSIFQLSRPVLIVVVLQRMCLYVVHVLLLAVSFTFIVRLHSVNP